MPVDETYHDGNTLRKVRDCIRKSTRSVLSIETMDEIVWRMQNEGILFRERVPEEVKNGER